MGMATASRWGREDSKARCALAPRDGTEFGALRRDERRDTRTRRRPRVEDSPGRR